MKAVANRQGKSILPSFQRLVKLIATHLTANVYAFIGHIDAKEKDSDKGVKRKRGDKEASAPKIGKSARFIPALIFAIEQYSQAILKVSKRTKEDLSAGFKPGTTRDFRIKFDKVNVSITFKELRMQLTLVIDNRRLWKVKIETKRKTMRRSNLRAPTMMKSRQNTQQMKAGTLHLDPVSREAKVQRGVLEDAVAAN